MSNEVWLNVVELHDVSKFYSNLVDAMVSNKLMWKKWYKENQPEEVPRPDYEQRLKDQNDISLFLKLLLVRSLCVDRSILMCKELIRNTKEMGPAFMDPVTDTIKNVYDEMVPEVPVVFLLSRGANLTNSITKLCQRK